MRGDRCDLLGIEILESAGITFISKITGFHRIAFNCGLSRDGVRQSPCLLCGGPRSVAIDLILIVVKGCNLALFREIVRTVAACAASGACAVEGGAHGAVVAASVSYGEDVACAFGHIHGDVECTLHIVVVGDEIVFLAYLGVKLQVFDSFADIDLDVLAFGHVPVLLGIDKPEFLDKITHVLLFGGDHVWLKGA